MSGTTAKIFFYLLFSTINAANVSAVCNRINKHSPYDVEYDDDFLVFTTEHGLIYVVDFDDDANPYFTAHWLNLRSVYGQPLPSDKEVAQTLICIIEEFFRQNADVLLYICSSDDGHQA